MVTQRIGREAGGKRKFLAIIDDTPECLLAATYAACRAKASGGGAVLLYVIEPGDFQHWLGVQKIMSVEANEEAETRISRVAEELREEFGIDPETVVREGKIVEEINNLIDEDREIAILVLAAGDTVEGPGPLVSSVAGKGSGFPIPVTIVPNTLSREEIWQLC